MVEIAVLDDYQNVAREMAGWARFEPQHRVTFFNERLADEGSVADALAGFDVVCLMRERTPFPESLVLRLPNLELIVTSAHRNAAIDMKAAAARNILVCGTDSPGHATAELTIGLILALARHIPFEADAMREGRWQTTIGRDLKGATLGILGLGRLGGQVARIGVALGMRPIAWSENLTQQRAAEHSAELVSKDELFRRSDFLTIHTKLSERTRGLVAGRELGLMKASAYLINTSRGPIVDKSALLEALRAGKIAGCALDVYDREPLPAEHPLRREPRALLTPHIGYVTQETYRAFYGGMVAAIEAWLAGKPINVLTE